MNTCFPSQSRINKTPITQIIFTEKIKQVPRIRANFLDGNPIRSVPNFLDRFTGAGAVEPLVIFESVRQFIHASQPFATYIDVFFTPVFIFNILHTGAGPDGNAAAPIVDLPNENCSSHKFSIEFKLRLVI